jgi:hypothetical protein
MTDNINTQDFLSVYTIVYTLAKPACLIYRGSFAQYAEEEDEQS